MSNPWIPNTEFVFINRGEDGYDKASVHAHVNELNQQIAELEQKLQQAYAYETAYVLTFRELYNQGVTTREKVQEILHPLRKQACKDRNVSERD